MKTLSLRRAWNISSAMAHIRLAERVMGKIVKSVRELEKKSGKDIGDDHFDGCI